jgi:hypothetical protein
MAQPVALEDAMRWIRSRVQTHADPDNWEPMIGAIELQVKRLGPIEGQACLSVLWQVALATFYLWGATKPNDQARAQALHQVHEMFEVVDGFLKQRGVQNCASSIDIDVLCDAIVKAHGRIPSDVTAYKKRLADNAEICKMLRNLRDVAPHYDELMRAKKAPTESASFTSSTLIEGSEQKIMTQPGGGGLQIDVDVLYDAIIKVHGREPPDVAAYKRTLASDDYVRKTLRNHGRVAPVYDEMIREKRGQAESKPRKDSVLLVAPVVPVPPVAPVVARRRWKRWWEWYPSFTQYEWWSIVMAVWIFGSVTFMIYEMVEGRYFPAEPEQTDVLHGEME